MNRLDGKVAFLSGAARGIGGAAATLMASVGAKVVIGDVLEERGRQTVTRDRSGRRAGDLRAARRHAGSELDGRPRYHGEAVWWPRHPGEQCRHLRRQGRRGCLDGRLAPAGRRQFDGRGAGHARGAAAPQGARQRQSARFGDRQSRFGRRPGGFAARPALFADQRWRHPVHQVDGAGVRSQGLPRPCRTRSIPASSTPTWASRPSPCVPRRSGPTTPRPHASSRPPCTRSAASGVADDIAKGIVFLASDDAGFMTGAGLVVDGGYTAQ